MPPKPTAITPTFQLRSPETETNYALFIDEPDRKTQPGPWPTVFLMDGDYFFDVAVQVCRELRAKNKIPALLLVGVGYGATFGEPGNRRGRDYTPTRSADEEPESGGADAFLRFLTQTLWPELGRRYPIRDDIRVLAGHSLGSLFALHALFQPRPFFNHVLASAPSVWWHNRSLLGLIAALRKQQSTLPAELFLGVGTKDTESMTGDLALLEKQLAAQPFEKLRIISDRFKGRDHYNSAADAFRAGLTAFFKDGLAALPRV
jgi:predicted alpha/beta superfamily hydrolase